MLITYQYNEKKRRNSIIETNGKSYHAIGKPRDGKSADTRFFGDPEKSVFVVKRPIHSDKWGPFSEDKIKNIDQLFEGEYKRECEMWNQVYPDKKAVLFTDGGLRLVLPCLPGITLQDSLNEDPDRIDRLSLYQKLLAVAYAIQNLYKLGFKYSDFNKDNVLIERQPNGLFQAYLIDFNCMQSIDDAGGFQELANLNSLLDDLTWNTCYRSIDALINGLIERIATLEENLTIKFK